MLTIPVASSVPTLTMPRMENRVVAVRAILSDASSTPAAANSTMSGNSAPTQAAAATRCSTSAAGWTMASPPNPPAAWPDQASVPANAAAKIAAAISSQGDARSRGDSNAGKVAARAQARAKRTSQSRPKVVCDSTVHSTPSLKTCPAGRSLIAAAVRTSHAAPAIAASARPIQAMTASAARTLIAAAPLPAATRHAGAAMRTANKTAPATSIVAAK